MAHKDVIQATTTTTGTGDITLVDKEGHPNFDHAYSATDPVEYSIDNGVQWEVGLGTYNGSDVLERTTVYMTWDGTTWTEWDGVTGLTPITLAGSSTVYGTNTAQNIDAPTVDNLRVDKDLAYSTSNGVFFGDGNTGFYESQDNLLIAHIAGATQFYWFSSYFRAANGASIQNSVASATVPTLTPAADFDTGIGAVGADSLSLIAGGIEAARYTEVSSHVLVTHQGNYGLTADVGSAQGSGVILSSNNEYSVVANAGDAATLPAAAAGLEIKVMNNGANAMDIFPASGDDIDGAGVNVAYSLAAGGRAIFHASDATNWNVF